MSGAEGLGDELDRGEPGGLAIYAMSAPRGLRLVGDLFSENADQLATALDADHDALGDLTLDVSELKFIDTFGLHVIARAAAQLDTRARLIIHAPRAWLRRVFLLS